MVRSIERPGIFLDERDRGDLVARLAALTTAGAGEGAHGAPAPQADQALAVGRLGCAFSPALAGKPRPHER